MDTRLSALNTSSSNWRELYLAAVHEADPDRRSSSIIEAEKAIAARARELFVLPTAANTERQALDSSLQSLQALRSCTKNGKSYKDQSIRLISSRHAQGGVRAWDAAAIAFARKRADLAVNYPCRRIGCARP